jgi:hypothetical protein
LYAHADTHTHIRLGSPKWVTEAAARIWTALLQEAETSPETFKKSDTPHGGESPEFKLERDSPAKADVVCLHIRRGDKLNSTDLYPNLQEETSPQNVLGTLLQHVPADSVLYLATNEPNATVFYAPLKESYSVFALDSFDSIVSAQEFLPSSLALVDYRMLKNVCQKVVNTFANERPKGFTEAFSLSKSNK